MCAKVEVDVIFQITLGAFATTDIVVNSVNCFDGLVDTLDRTIGE